MVKIEGVDNLVKTLNELHPKLKKRVVRSSLRKAGNVIGKQVKQNADALDDPKTPAKISKHVSIISNTRAERSTGDTWLSLGIRGGAKNTGPETKTYRNNKVNRRLNRVGKTYQVDNVYYWRFLEFGTSKMRARPFFLPAVKEKQTEFFNEFIRQFKQGLAKEIK